MLTYLETKKQTNKPQLIPQGTFKEFSKNKETSNDYDDADHEKEQKSKCD